MRAFSLMDRHEPAAVILVTTFLNTQTGGVIAGGRPRIVRDVARHLVQRGLSVLVAQKGDADSIVQWEPGISVATVRCPIPTWGDLVFALRTRGIARSVPLCCYATPDDGFPFFAKRSFAIQHGIWWDGPCYTGLRGWLVRILQRTRSLVLCRRTRLVLCVDSNFPNYLRLLGPAGCQAERKCVYLPNYADLSRLPAPTASELKCRFAGRKLLFLRRFEPNRGPLLFVEACRVLRDSGFPFTAEMVGWGNDAALVNRRISEHGLQDHISVSSTTLDSAAETLGGAAVSLVPSLWSEGTSLSAIESVVMGVPVIATDVGGLANVVIPGFNGDVVPADAGALARSVIRILSDQSRYEALAANCVQMRPACSKERWMDSLDAHLAHAGILEPRPEEESPRTSVAAGLAAAEPSA